MVSDKLLCDLHGSYVSCQSLWGLRGLSAQPYIFPDFVLCAPPSLVSVVLFMSLWLLCPGMQ